jgi:hypothetical protein
VIEVPSMVSARTLGSGLAGSCLVVLMAGPAAAHGGTAPQSSPAGQAQSPAPAPSIVSRAIQPDGAIELTYSDGTKRRVALDSAAASGAGSVASEAASPVAPPEWLKDPATNQAFLDAMGEYYRYRGSGLRHRSRVFEWQLVSSKLIFVTVLMLVGAGMVFAAIQFRVGLKRPRGEGPGTANQGPPTGVAAVDVATQIDLSATSVKVSSPVLGVIILVISLAFFYLYLVYVYPISEIL